MAIPLTSYPTKVSPPTFDYPSGRPINNDGSGQATKVNRETLGDMWQFFFKLLRDANITPNGLPDNEYSGNQYVAAAKINFRRYQGTPKLMSLAENFIIAPNEQCLIFQMPGSLTGGMVTFPLMTATEDGHTVKVVNRDASETIAIVSADANIDWLGASPYTQAASTTREFTLIKSLGTWVITEKGVA